VLEASSRDDYPFFGRVVCCCPSTQSVGLHRLFGAFAGGLWAWPEKRRKFFFFAEGNVMCFARAGVCRGVWGSVSIRRCYKLQACGVVSFGSLIHCQVKSLCPRIQRDWHGAVPPVGRGCPSQIDGLIDVVSARPRRPFGLLWSLTPGSNLLPLGCW